MTRNPFSAQRLRPGAIPYCWPPGWSAERWLEQLRAAGWWGELIGPHGCGKSSLLAALREPLQQAGRRLAWFSLQGGERRLPPHNPASWNADTQVVVDGFEQLRSGARAQLQRQAREAGAGLLLTAHHTMGLPPMFLPAIDLAWARQISAALQEGYPPRIGPDDLPPRFARHGGNLRELLFELYDLYEQRRRAE